MKTIFKLVLLLLIASSASAQVPQSFNYFGARFKRSIADSSQSVPTDTTKLHLSLKGMPAIAVPAGTDSVLYIWSVATQKWKPVVGGGGGVPGGPDSSIYRFDGELWGTDLDRYFKIPQDRTLKIGQDDESGMLQSWVGWNVYDSNSVAIKGSFYLDDIDSIQYEADYANPAFPWYIDRPLSVNSNNQVVAGFSTFYQNGITTTATNSFGSKTKRNRWGGFLDIDTTKISFRDYHQRIIYDNLTGIGGSSQWYNSGGLVFEHNSESLSGNRNKSVFGPGGTLLFNQYRKGVDTLSTAMLNVVSDSLYSNIRLMTKVQGAKSEINMYKDSIVLNTSNFIINGAAYGGGGSSIGLGSALQLYRTNAGGSAGEWFTLTNSDLPATDFYITNKLQGDPNTSGAGALSVNEANFTGIPITGLSTAGATTNYVLKYNGSAIAWAVDATGSVTVPGSDGDFLYNNAGAFGALSQAKWNNALSRFELTGGFLMKSGNAQIFANPGNTADAAIDMDASNVLKMANSNGDILLRSLYNDLRLATHNGTAWVDRLTVKNSGTINLSTVLVYADEAAAVAGGVLVTGDLYVTSTGQLMRKQ